MPTSFTGALAPRFLRFTLLFCLPVLVAVGATAPRLADNVLRLEAGDYVAEFADNGHWTIHTLAYKGVRILLDSGAHQTVLKLHPAPGLKPAEEFVGTKHGGEVIESLTLEVDGKSYPLAAPLTAPAGSSYKVVRVTRYGPILGRWTVSLDANGVRQHVTFEQSAPLDPVSYGYVFMHCFNPDMREWRALLPNGSIEGARFPEERTQSLKKDITALAVYSEKDNTGAVLVYPEAYQGLAGRKNFINYWPARHTKHYLTLSPARMVGRTYESHLRAFQSSPANWEDAARSLMSAPFPSAN